MTLPVVFRRRFRNDLAAGYDWYENQRAGLGEEFLAASQTTVKSIEPYAEMFAAVHGDVRRALVRRFPFRATLDPIPVVRLVIDSLPRADAAQQGRSP
jgi:hypothetical protein